jgi:carbonic anhydrase/acetyltransferase-like protein (isoleucine patch superfamily)
MCSEVASRRISVETTATDSPVGRSQADRHDDTAIQSRGIRVLIEHQGKRPSIDPTAHVAATAVICGDVTIGPRTYVSYGAVIEAHGTPVRIGAQCVLRENLNIRSTTRDAVHIGDYVLIGPHSSLKGCTVDECFLATGVKIYQGARIGRCTEVRIDGIVHVRSVLPPNSLVPIRWVAVGDRPSCSRPTSTRNSTPSSEGWTFPGRSMRWTACLAVASTWT